MNPKGKWVFRNLEDQYINESISALYGKVFPVLGDDSITRWYWEVRTGLNSRIKDSEYPRGYAKTREQAREIVEALLKHTETVEF